MDFNLQKRISSNQIAQEHEAIVLNRKYKIMKGVFSPAIFNLASQWTLTNLIEIIPKMDQIQKKDYLELGCGCGCAMVQVLLNSKCNFKTIMGTDLFEQSVLNVAANIKLYQNQMDQSRITPERLTLIQSDVFESIDKKKKFDVIFWNFPFGMSDGKEKEMSAIRRGCTDPEYKSLKKLLVQLPQRLKAGGKLYLSFSRILGNIQLLYKLCEQNKLSITQMFSKQNGMVVLNEITIN